MKRSRWIWQVQTLAMTGILSVFGFSGTLRAEDGLFTVFEEEEAVFYADGEGGVSEAADAGETRADGNGGVLQVEDAGQTYADGDAGVSQMEDAGQTDGFRQTGEASSSDGAPSGEKPYSTGAPSEPQAAESHAGELVDFIPAGKEPENDRSVHQVSEEEKEKEKRRIGTVTNGEYTVHLGESREQILEELGKPLETTIADETAALEAAGIFSLCDTYDGVRIYYRSYRRLAEMYEWMDARDLALETFAENTGNQENPASNGQDTGAETDADLETDGGSENDVVSEMDTGAETDADSETDLVPGTDLLSEMMPGPDLRVVYLYLENGTYRTADGIMCGDTEEDVKKVKTVAGEEQIFEQTLYNGEYLTWDDWNRIFEDFSDDQPSQIRMLLNTRAVSMVMNDAGRSVESIIVGDALAIKYWT